MRLKVETEKNNSHHHLKGSFSFSSQNMILKENNSRSRLDTIILPCKIVLINHIINIFTVLTITIIIFRLNAITSSLVIRSVWFAYSIAMVAFNRLFLSPRIDPLTKISFRVASSIYVQNCIHLKSASIIQGFIISKCEASGAKLDQSSFNEDKISFLSHDCSFEKFKEMQNRPIMLRIRIFHGF